TSASAMLAQRWLLQSDAGAPTIGVERPRVWRQNQLRGAGNRPGPRDGRHITSFRSCYESSSVLALPLEGQRTAHIDGGHNVLRPLAHTGQSLPGVRP